MPRTGQVRDTHEKFRVMSALAIGQSLTAQEFIELTSHLNHCRKCRTVAFQYLVLVTRGEQILLTRYGQRTGPKHPQVLC
jgi:hypothetical protein